MNFNSLLGNLRKKNLAAATLRRTRSRRSWLKIDSLEDRTAPAVLPTPTIEETAKTPLQGVGTTTPGEQPMTLTDPTASARLVTVYTTGTQIQLAYSTDSGVTWDTTLVADVADGVADGSETNVDIDPTSPEGTEPPILFTKLTSPTVAFDRFHNVFVCWEETNATDTTSGQIVIEKFDFSGGVPVPTVDPSTGNTPFLRRLNEYVDPSDVGRSIVFSPIIAIDTNQATFQDPDVAGAAGLQTDAHVSTQTSAATTKVYVAFAQINHLLDTPVVVNSHDIVMVVSGDGGQNYATEEYANDDAATVFPNLTAATDSRPEVVFTQGRAGVTNSGGQMVIAFDTGSAIDSDASAPSANDVTVGVSGQTGGIADRPSGSNPTPPPQSTTFNINITSAEVPANFTTLADINETLAITHDDLKQLRATLIDPSGTRSVVLFYNGIADDGTTDISAYQGISGTALGVNNWDPNTGFGWVVGTTFADGAGQSIRAGTAPYIGRFRPEEGNPGMSVFDGMTRTQVIGTWKLVITDYENGGVGNVRLNKLTLSSGINTTAFGPDNVTGAVTSASTIDPALSPFSGYSVAVNNTLGAFSPYENRVYIATSTGVNGGDVELSYGDFEKPTGLPFGLYWGTDVQSSWTINDDFAGDGFSEGNRRQYNPALAVDPVTGTLAITYYDNRYDPANVRSVVSFTTSITQPEYGTLSPVATFEFAKSVVLNPMEQAFDESTTTTVNLEPVPTNVPVAPGDFNERTGLAVYGGIVNSVWAGNLDTTGSELRTQQLTIAAGPRIVSGDMGPIIANGYDSASNTTYNNTFNLAGDGRREFDGFIVTFDRPVDPNTFSPADVTVLFRGPTDNPAGPGTTVPVTNVQPLDSNAYGATKFLVSVAPQTKTGTYSYTVGPTINDRIRSQGVASGIPDGSPTTFTAVAPQVPKPIPDQSTITSTITVPAGSFSPTDVFTGLTVSMNIAHNDDSDLLITLTAPNNQTITLVNHRGGTSTGFNITLDDAAAQLIANAPTSGGTVTGTYQPDQALGGLLGSTPNGVWTLTVSDTVAGNTGTLQGWSLSIKHQAPSTQFTAVAPQVPKAIPDAPAAGITSTITVPAGTFSAADVVAGLTVNLNISHTYDSDLLVTLKAPNNRTITLIAQRGGADHGYSITLDDASTQLIAGAMTADGSAITGTYRPDQPLANIYGSTPIGVWTLSVTDEVHLDTGTLQSWSINITPGKIVSGAANNRNFMDQNSDTLTGQPNSDQFDVPNPINGVPFQLPYTTDTLPLSLPGAHVVSTLAQGETTTPDITDHVVKDKSVSYIDVAFDRKMGTATFTAADVLQVIGPVGRILGTAAQPIKVLPIDVLGAATTDAALTSSKYFRVFFPTQTLNGSYRIQLGPNILDSDLNPLDSDENAGVDNLTGRGVGGLPAEDDYSTGNVNIVLGAGKSTIIPISVSDAFLIQKVTLTMSMTHPDVRELTAKLIAPDGTAVLLFNRNIGFNGSNHADMDNTTFDDAAQSPIQTGTAPFQGVAFDPQQPLSQLIGHGSAGQWELVITDSGTDTGNLTLFSLHLFRINQGTGLGEPTADQASTAFRIFNSDPTIAQAKNTWMPVGPADVVTKDAAGNIIDETTEGRVGAVAVDPSDPSGNTVYVGAASGGVWRTTNFLTQDPAGPTWIQLTDFGPTDAINIGAIAVYNSTNDPSKSIIVVGTGEQSSMDLSDPYNYPTTGVGFLVSTDAGVTWHVQDSTINNADGPDADTLPGDGAPLAITDPLRDHTFVGTVVNKLVFDPGLDPFTHLPVIYAAVGEGQSSGADPAGIWRSSNLGGTWTRLTTGTNGGPIDDYSDFVLSNASVDAVTGQPQILFAAVPGQGIFRSINRGTSWTLMAGTVGNALIRDDNPAGQAVPVGNPLSSPDGAKGNIILATPALSGSAFSDRYFGGWLYAVVSGTGGDLDGLYETKDFGDNWTKIRIASTNYTATTTLDDGFGFATNNDVGNLEPDLSGALVVAPDLDVNVLNGDGNQGLALAIDPNNPNIVYVGSDTMIRVDTTAVWDAHNLTVYSNSNMLTIGTGPVRPSTVGSSPVQIPEGTIGYTEPGLLGVDSLGRLETTPTTGQEYSDDLAGDPDEDPAREFWNYLNLFRNPDQPFPGATDTTQFTENLLLFSNTGQGATWNYVETHTDAADPTVGLDEDWGDQTSINRMVSIIDPLTGKARIIFGDDKGIHTFVTDNDNDPSIGTGVSEPTNERGLDDGPTIVTGAIPGRLNMGIGYAAPINGTRNGNLQIAQFRTGAVQPSLLAADIAKSMFYGSSATDDEDSAASSSTELSDGNIQWTADARGTPATWVETDKTGTGIVYELRTTDLTDVPTDFFQVILPGQAPVGRTFGLFEAGDNPYLNQGQWRDGLTKFAVNPIDPNGIAMGSLSGQIFLTTGMGISGVGQWFKIATANELDGSYAAALAFGAPQHSGGGALDSFIYAGTQDGNVFVTFDQGGTWKDLTPAGSKLDGSPIQEIVADPGRGSTDVYVVTEKGVYVMADSSAATPVWTNITSNLPAIMTNGFGNTSWSVPLAESLDTMAIDWRFKYDKNPRPPEIYVGGDGGVFRSTDGGATWQRYPNVAVNGSYADGGGLPVVRVTDLELSTGNIQPATGLPNPSGSPDLLVAATMGRGMWSIRVPSPTISGPSVISQSLNTPVLAPGATVSQLDITFDTAINPDTFTVADIAAIITPFTTITDPATIASMVTLQDITFPAAGQPNLHNKWRLVFNTPFSRDGTYKIVIGPNIDDWAGRPMDQNGNSINGEAVADQYDATIVIAENDVGDFVQDSYGELLTQPGQATRQVTTTEYLGTAVQGVETARYTALGTVIKELLVSYNSSEARHRLVERLFSNGNAPLEIGNLLPGYILTAAEETTFVNGLNAGTLTPETIIGDILLKPDYYAAAGSTPIGFLTQVYADLFKGSGIEFSWLPQATQLKQLTEASSAAGRSKLVRALVGKTGVVQYYQDGDISTPLQTTYFRDWEVELAYEKYLGRPATAAEITAGKAQVDRPGAKGTLEGSEWMIASVLTSKEYFGLQTQSALDQNLAPGTPGATTLPDVGLHTNRSWVDAVIRDRFYRTTDSDGDGLPSTWVERNTFSQKILDLYKTARTTFLQGSTKVVGLVASTEFRTAQIKTDYQMVFGPTRVVSDTEMNAALALLAKKGTFQNLIANLFGSDEFYQDAPTLVGDFSASNLAWARAVYLQLFGTDPGATDPRVIALANKAGTTVKTRTAAAQLVLTGTAATNPNGTAYRTLQIDNAFALLLNRAPTTTGAGNELDTYQTYLKKNRWEYMLVQLMLLREYWEIAN